MDIAVGTFRNHTVLDKDSFITVCKTCLFRSKDIRQQIQGLNITEPMSAVFGCNQMQLLL